MHMLKLVDIYLFHLRTDILCSVIRLAGCAVKINCHLAGRVFLQPLKMKKICNKVPAIFPAEYLPVLLNSS